MDKQTGVTTQLEYYSAIGRGSNMNSSLISKGLCWVKGARHKRLHLLHDFAYKTLWKEKLQE